MDFNIEFDLTQSQKLLLTPQLKQALDILAMNSQELFTYVEEQLETNPVLDFAENEILDYEESTDDISEGIIDSTTAKLTLKGYLLFQLHTSDMDRNQKLIGEYLINSIDENGYLTINLSEVAALFNIPIALIKNVLQIIQTFDPPGVCARNLKECLLIQLKQMHSTNSGVIMIIENYLDDLALNRVTEVAEATGLNSEEVTNIFSLIKSLQPKPGRGFYNSDNLKFIVADVIVKKINDKYKVLINEDAVPAVNINDFYRQVASKDVSSETRKFIQSRINNGIWLIKCIEHRKSVLIRIVEFLASRQHDFFEKGKRYIELIDIETAANELNIHEHILRNAIEGKYIQCLWGDFEMKSFFNLKI